MRGTAILKNNSTAEKRREEEAFALESIAHYCFVETKSNCDKRSAKDWIEHPSISSEQNESAQKALNGQDSNTRGSELVSQAAGEAEQNREINAMVFETNLETQIFI